MEGRPGATGTTNGYWGSGSIQEQQDEDEDGLAEAVDEDLSNLLESRGSSVPLRTGSHVSLGAYARA